MTMTFNKSLGRPVVDANTADDVGEVKALVVDVAGNSITQVQIAGRKRKPLLVAWSDISSFGDDVVLISSVDNAHEADSDRATETTKGDIEFVGNRVLTTEGDELGVVTDVHFDSASGAIEAAMTTTAGRVSAERICSVGTYAVVIRAED